MSALENAPLEERQVVVYPQATGFALLLVGAGVALTLIPEFVYLRDNFAMRINTIFKFYYQAWALFSIAGAYAVYSMLAAPEKAAPAPRAVLSVLVGSILTVGLLYPALGLQARAWLESGRNAAGPQQTALTLDGGPTTVSPDDYAAIMCLDEMVEGGGSVVLEAADPRSAYNVTGKWGRVSMLTGIPIIMGLQNHQGQWRGPTYNEVVGTRPQDIDRIYSDLRWDVVQPLLEQYSIDYIFFGETERAKYGSTGEQKFMDNLETLCERGGSRFFRVASAVMAAAR